MNFQKILSVFALALAIGTAACTTTHQSVADIGRKTDIWQNPAGSSPQSKLADMKINESRGRLPATLGFIKAIVGENYSADAEQKIDTFTYAHSIKRGYEKTTYQDTPYIIPYLVPNSKGAVIVVSGGGYAYQTMDGGTGESKDIAVKLNQAGISAFVLHYRANPYHYPTPMLDLQRAVRYIKAHANEFGIHPDKISAIGFSAGGNLVATYVNIIQGKNHFPANYQVDNIDKIDDSLVSVAMIYPALTYQYNVNMLFSLFDSQLVHNSVERAKLLQLTDLPQHINAKSVPQFISYSKADGMVDYRGTERYITSAKNKGVAVTVAEVQRQDHGYKPEHYWDRYIDFVLQHFEK
ncbi:acetyl esterase/lipase [Neisseria sp. HSC-16F19]|nr:alpha/beta hydrolase [Neisseria sp. HSC-16F19]MCP2041575.1 acetyl esterase/lipase [Neisseria sp. HSC-16F19]